MSGELKRPLMLRLLLVSLLSLGAAPLYAVPADPDASPATVALHQYLTNLPNQPDHRLISGQWGGWRGMEAKALARQERIHDRTGHYPGLWGNLAWDTTKPPTLPQTFTLTPTTIKNTIDWWNQGGLVEIGGFFPNPSSGGDPNDLTITGSYTDIYTDDGNATNVNFKATLDQLAAGLQPLEDAGVVVLFRPLMEMNGDWFWWGANGDHSQFIALWQYTFHYLTQTKGLHNLLFVFAPFRDQSMSVMMKYPGNNYVDIVGADTYDYAAKGGEIFNYDELVATGKPFALTEFGAAHYGHNPPGDLNAAIQDIKTNMPRAVYFMTWNENYAIDLQTNARAALNDPWVQNRPRPHLPIPDPSPDQSELGVNEYAPLPESGATGNLCPP